MVHYDKKYFDWQKGAGEFGGRENLFKFKKFIKPGSKVLEFGCGGGFLLSNIECGEKIGIEINPFARENAAKLGINATENAASVPDDWADYIISDNVLEHTFCPLDELKKLRPKLKKGGKLIFVIPHEFEMDYVEKDINQHLYTWNALCAGNLFTLAGFRVLNIEKLKYLWPPGAYLIRKYLGKIIFDAACRLYYAFFGKWCQLRVTAERAE